MSEPSPRPAIATAPLSVVLIARVMDPELPARVQGWNTLFVRRGGEYEIILVVDGNGHDPATEQLPTPFANDPCIRLIQLEMSRGFGAALRTAIEAARFPLLFYTSADGQYNSEDFKLLLDQIDHVDLISGCRDANPAPFWQRGLASVWHGFLRVVMGVTPEKVRCWPGWEEHRRSWFAWAVFGLRLHDVDCAFRLFRREIFERIPIQSDSAFAQVEILAKANFLGCIMTQVPVHYHAPPKDTKTYWNAWSRKEIKCVLTQPGFRAPPQPTPLHEADQTGAPDSSKKAAPESPTTRDLP
jgi:glycosyltransferase involved in cell wall biosynthesis